MKLHLLSAILFAGLVLRATLTGAQVPPPVDLPIQNIPQQEAVWCWAAVAQQIIAASRGPASTPPQCALVAIANGAAPQVCCSMRNPMCMRTGSIQQIQGLIAEFGGRSSSVAPPADPMVLYNTLASGRPILIQVRTSVVTAHVVVLRGMSFVRTPYGIEPVLHINDPLSYFTRPVPFSRIMGIWTSAIVVD